MGSLTMNQMGVINNFYQNLAVYKRVVTVCSAGCLRSPTAAVVLSQDPFNFNTRVAGLTDEFAITPLSDRLMAWADEFVVMEDYMVELVLKRYKRCFGRDLDRESIPVYCLDIPDDYSYRDPELMELIKTRYEEVSDG